MYLSCDEVTEDEADGLANRTIGIEDLLATLKEPGVPPHELRLKVGAVCSIMRNLAVDKGLVKNARVVVAALYTHCVAVRLVNGSGQETYHLPRITFKFHPRGGTYDVDRRQIPLRLAYSTTFNSCQGLTLNKAVINLRCPVFAHGQLYTAFSRVRVRDDMRVLIESDLGDGDAHGEVTNVVYQELLLR